jgi:hypothetical protein
MPYGSVNLSQTFFRRHIGISPRDSVAQFIESSAQASNTGEKFGIDKGSHRLPILINDDAVVPVLHLIDHFPKVLAEIDGVDFCDHHWLLVTMTSMVIMVDMASICPIDAGARIAASSTAKIEGDWAGRITGLAGQRVEIAMTPTPDGHSRLELSRSSHHLSSRITATLR